MDVFLVYAIHAGSVFARCSNSRAIDLTSPGSYKDTPPVPFTAMAFKFLLPITAPTPPRPAALTLSHIKLAIGTSFSPGGPIDTTLYLGSFSMLRILSSVSQVFFPHISPAGISSIWSSVITSIEGSSAFPLITIPS